MYGQAYGQQSAGYGQQQSASAAYLAALQSRLTADGCSTRWEDWGGTQVLVGRRSDFRMRWMATNLHLFTVAAAVPVITAGTIESFTDSVLKYARDTKSGLPVGLQTGVGAFPVLVGESVEPAAVHWAEAQQRTRFACMARPVVVDSTHQYVGMYRGKPALGRVYASHFIEKGTRYFYGA
ncbi:levansucrase [Streptomyces hygroscopicus]|uniref:levansucrase n=1 Tax=Streptomyces hygroscopicus TaxID=1912 RepID=UPI00223FB717|nr:levansucrase [Streptomyces hygroscopicus]MCW7946546.1 levansucrase [Streptomyces hygroscopicus]